MKNQLAARSAGLPLLGVAIAAALAASLAFAQKAQTRDAQTALTPQQVLDALKAGNERFVTGKPRERDRLAEVRATAEGQFPVAAIMGCLDSRVPPELIFDMAIGDLFVGRVAGNYVDTDMLGSFEFATKVAGAKVVVVLGHNACGAIKGACDGVKMGNLTHTLSNLAPAIYAVPDTHGPGNASNDKFVEAVTRANVEMNVRAVLDRSEVLRELADSGKLKVVGALYDLSSGRVTFLE